MRAIDVHVHPSTEPFHYERRWGKEVADFLPKYYRLEPKVRTDDEMAQEFRDLDIKALLIGWDAQAESGYGTQGTNDEIARLIKAFPDGPPNTFPKTSSGKNFFPHRHGVL